MLWKIQIMLNCVGILVFQINKHLKEDLLSLLLKFELQRSEADRSCMRKQLLDISTLDSVVAVTRKSHLLTNDHCFKCQYVTALFNHIPHNLFTIHSHTS